MTEQNKILIEVRLGAKSIKVYDFSIGSEILIGRSKDAHIQLDARDISRRHAFLYLKPDGFKIEDLSLNGTAYAKNDTADNHSPKDLGLYGSSFKIGSFLIIPTFSDSNNNKHSLATIRKKALLHLIEQMDLSGLEGDALDIAPKVEAALDRILFSLDVKDSKLRASIKSELRDEAIGLGPLEKLLKDDKVSEIMVVSHNTIYVEESGTLKKSELVFSSEDSVRTVIDRIIAPLGRRIDESSPMVDARLLDGSRVNAVIPPLAIKGSTITIRKFSKRPFTIDNLINFKTLNKEMALFLQNAVKAKQNIVISGGTGSGKTTLLNVLSGQIGNNERVITIEDAAELQLNQPHLVSLESKPGNTEGKGAVTIRDLVKNALRMRPDRIVVGECRGGEALDMLQAMNTGHDGSLTTTHANSPVEAVARLETLSLMAGLNLPSRAIREQIAGAVDLIVQQNRFSDGSRKITSITEVIGMDEDGNVKLSEIFSYKRKNKNDQNGGFLKTGWLPRFMINS